MGFITKLRIRRGLALLHKRCENSERRCDIISFSKVNSIVLLYEIKLSKIPEAIGYFSQALTDENKKVYHVIYYSGNPKSLTLDANSHRIIFTRKQLNFFYMPCSKLVDELTTINANYWMDINLTESFPLIYLTALSNAQLRIGKQSLLRLHHYDLLINHQTDNQKVFIDHLMHYLKILKPPHND